LAEHKSKSDIIDESIFIKEISLINKSRIDNYKEKPKIGIYKKKAQRPAL